MFYSCMVLTSLFELSSFMSILLLYKIIICLLSTTIMFICSIFQMFCKQNKYRVMWIKVSESSILIQCFVSLFLWLTLYVFKNCSKLWSVINMLSLICSINTNSSAINKLAKLTTWMLFKDLLLVDFAFLTFLICFFFVSFVRSN